MRILIFSDSHGDFEPVLDILDSTYVDFCLCCGDFGFHYKSCLTNNRHITLPKKYPDAGQLESLRTIGFQRSIYFIRGNHDCMECLESYTNNIPNLFYLRNGLTNINGIFVLSLGGNYSPTHYFLTGEEIATRQQRRKHYINEEIKGAKMQKNVDIFISHEGPDSIGIIGKSVEDMGKNPIREIIECVQPRLAVFGHYHHKYQGEIGLTKYYGVPSPDKNVAFLDTETWEVEWRNI